MSYFVREWLGLIIMCFASTGVAVALGFNITSWQFWAIYGVAFVARQTGRYLR